MYPESILNLFLQQWIVMPSKDGYNRSSSRVIKNLGNLHFFFSEIYFFIHNCKIKRNLFTFFTRFCARINALGLWNSFLGQKEVPFLPKKPKLSIITCTHNSEKFLTTALASIEMQTFRDFEHIINDSYSTDSTSQIIADYIQRHAGEYPIKLIQTPAQGVANALNMATREANGEIVHYLHSDDNY